MTMERYLFALPDLCTGCSRCVYVCSAVKEGSFFPSRSRIHLNNFPLQGYSVPSICFQCEKPECLEACPEEAISRNEQDVVVVEAEKCNGCGECVQACPYGMIWQEEGGLACKCDYCAGDPACVKECYPRALVYEEAEKELRRLRGLQMKQRVEGGSPEEKRHQVGKNLLGLAR